MSWLVDINEELNEQFQRQLRKFRKKSAGTNSEMWYRVQKAITKARDMTIYHGNIEDFIMPNLFDENGDPIMWYQKRDPQLAQVQMIKQHLKETSRLSRKRGRVTPKRLKDLMLEILNLRIEKYLNPSTDMKKLKIMCIVGESGCGKTLASLHLKYHKDANVICSFTTRKPRPTEVEGRDHHFIDIVPDPSQLLAYTHFNHQYYYATKEQVYGPCTVYVIDEKGLANLKEDFGDEYDIYSVLIKRDKQLRRQYGVSNIRMSRDKDRVLIDEEFDYVIENNGRKKELFDRIESIYDEIKNK